MLALEVAKKQFADQVKIRLISQLINSIQGFFKNYLDILMLSLFQHLLYHRFLFTQLFVL